MLSPTCLCRGLLRLLLKIPGRRCIVRMLCHCAALVVILGSPFVFYNLYVNSVELHFYDLHMRNVTRTAAFNGCTFPNFDPFDPRWKSFFFKESPIACGEKQPYLTFVDAQGYIRINESGVREAGLRDDEYECMYSFIRRKPGTDDEILFSYPQVFRKKEKLKEGFVRAQCVTRPARALIYETGHAFVPPMSRELSARVQPASPLRPSVLLIGLDSMSRLNFIRQLPKTHGLLKDVFGATVFNGLIKVGDNTYPNMLTMLSGIAARKKNGIPVREWGSKRAYGYFDDLPLAWMNFTENGYVTMYAEDEPEFNAFNYMAKGFIDVPTDYYMRPFWLGMQEMKTFRSRDERCYHNYPNFDYLFNYTREFVLKMRDRRFFSLNFLTGFSHSRVNQVQVVDDALHDLLAEFHKSGALRSAVLLVFGDHGNRFDSWRSTVVGRVEERMPYLAVVLPPDLRDARPYLQEALQINRDTLISWYDVYEMLTDIALDNLQPTPRVTRFGQLGFSLFRPVPTGRTCLEAGVAEEFCVCSQEVPMTTDDPMVVSAAHALVRYLNAQLAKSRPIGACAPLRLVQVVNAQKIVPAWQVSRVQGFSVTLRVTVRLSPSDALLEATLERDAWDQEERVVGDVSRINKYGNQSHCVYDRRLRLYCYCLDLLPKSTAGIETPAGG